MQKKSYECRRTNLHSSSINKSGKAKKFQRMDLKSCYKVSSACGGVGELSIHPSKNFCLAKEHLIKGTIHQTGHEDTVFKQSKHTNFYRSLREGELE